ncbi:hypothetical protein DWU89_05975 [Parabacteroides acidifaciens]|uniref:Uncharacterized protein n=1 Tax=Parabacteroides acidifaciens TaxID=2290935 RepID=A0A3D8HGJ9_9BACT|nr:hypothetical protein DWU89_05975 [Parabacteroides acidifaciens]
MDGRNWKEDRPKGKKAPEFPWDIWNTVRFIFKYSILRELSFITLLVFPYFGNQNVRFLKRSRHLVFLLVKKRG